MLTDLNGKPMMPKAAKMFPAFIQFGPNVKVFLELDGSCHGDLEAAIDAIAEMPPGPDLPIIWSFVRAIQDQLRRNQESEGDVVEMARGFLG